MIIDIMGEVCKSLSEKRGHTVNYIFGDSSYIRESLLKMSKCKNAEAYKYPLIGLYSPFEEYRGNEDYFCKASVNMILAVRTLDSYSNEQRLEISFKGFLRPLYNDFMTALKDSSRFDFGYSDIIPHAYVENYSFGHRGAVDTDGESLDEKIDAIEIRNLELTVKNMNCYANRY